jgi:hypothetical protein
MKEHKVLLILLIPAFSLLMLVLMGNHGESAIIWGLLYLFLLFVYFLAGLIMLAIEKQRKNGLFLLLGVGILMVIGFGVCSGL